MTEKIAQWLSQWAGQGMSVGCECTEMMPGRMGVYRRGVVSKQEYPDGSADAVVRFGIEMCLWTQTQADRQAACAQIDGIEGWIRAQDAAGNLPETEEGECWRTEIVNGFAMKRSGAAESVFAAEMDVYVLMDA